MSLEGVEREFETYLLAQASVPVDVGQDGFDTTEHDEWLRGTVLGGIDITLEVTGESYETTGTFEVQIFTKNKRRNAALYDELAAAFRNQNLNGVRTLDPNRIVAGKSNGYWQTNLSVQWEIDTNE